MSWIIRIFFAVLVRILLPLFFLETFEGLGPVKAAMLASAFAFMNLAARPGGGWISDRFGRRKTLMILIGGLAVGYLVMSQVSSTWPVALAVVALDLVIRLREALHRIELVEPRETIW